MPTVANGLTLDWNVARARGENFELECYSTLLPKRATTLRALAFVNHANMGSHREAIDGYLSGKDRVPNITEYRKQGRVKYGFGLNVEQELAPLWRAFGRLGWNDGANESYAYTEIDRTAEVGTDLRGSPGTVRWTGFILGDGGLNYGLEKIFETHYAAHVWRGMSVAVDYQHVTNPGYNQDRGPASIVGFRLHLEDAIPFDRFRHGN